MKVLMKQIEMIAWFAQNGEPSPLKFKLLQNNEPITIKVDRIVDRSHEKAAGNHMLVFLCESSIEDVVKRYELKYELGTCKWYLSRM